MEKTPVVKLSAAVRLAAMALGLVAGAIMGAATASAQQIEGATWRAERISGVDVRGTAPTLSLAGGRLAGSGGCNRLMGAASITGNGIAFGGVATTRMACPPPVMAQEQAFIAALNSTRSFRVDGGRLILLDARGVEMLRFVRQA